MVELAGTAPASVSLSWLGFYRLRSSGKTLAVNGWTTKTSMAAIQGLACRAD